MFTAFLLTRCVFIRNSSFDSWLIFGITRLPLKLGLYSLLFCTCFSFGMFWCRVFTLPFLFNFLNFWFLRSFLRSLLISTLLFTIHTRPSHYFCYACSFLDGAFLAIRGFFVNRSRGGQESSGLKWWLQKDLACQAQIRSPIWTLVGLSRRGRTNTH